MRNAFLIYFLFMLLFISCNDGEHNEEEVSKEIYTCPMHSEIIRNAPGTCPICGMDLVKKEDDAKAVKNIELETLLKPTDAFVVSTVPVTALQQREEETELNVTGRVTYDTRQTGAISSRIPGRIERLYIRYKYQPVSKGQKIMEVYSPTLVTAQQNLLFLLRSDAQNTSLINAAKDRLLLLGMSSSQVSQVMRSGKPQYSVSVFSNYNGFVTDVNNKPAATNEMQSVPASNQELSIKEGMYVQSGQTLFTVYDQSKAWILLDIFPEQQNMIRVGNYVRVVPETAPSKNFRARIDYIEPVFRDNNKTLSARVYFNNASMQLPIGSRVTAIIFAQSQNAMWLPKEAVITLGRDQIVFKKEGNGFRAHKIITAAKNNNYIQVTSGLKASDSVAANAQFMVDNETFIKIQEQ